MRPLVAELLLLLPTLAFQPTSSLPPAFDRAAFEAYLQRRPGLLASRWATFVRETTPLQAEVARLWASGRLRRDDSSLSIACRSTLTRLGPTFVKLGQILSVREDVLGPVWATEMAKLQDGVEPFDGDEALGAVAEGFGQPLSSLFESLEREPVAAASLAQVHRGLWRVDGGEAVPVAVKVLRPGVAELVAADLCVLLRAGEVLQQWAPRLLPASRIEWSELLSGLAAGLWEETDLSAEAQRQRRFGENMRRVEGGRVFVPAVLASTRGVMVSEWVEGVPLRALPPRSAALQAAQARMRDAYCQMMFVDGLFHADCHGGNLLWVAGEAGGEGRLCILDCGLMVQITAAEAEGLLRLSLHLAAREWASVVEDAVALGFLPASLSDTQRATARGVARRLLNPYLEVGGGARAASSYQLPALLQDLSTASTSLPTSLPPSMVLLGRVRHRLAPHPARTPVPRGAAPCPPPCLRPLSPPPPPPPPPPAPLPPCQPPPSCLPHLPFAVSSPFAARS